jgi:hypothetical protein
VTAIVGLSAGTAAGGQEGVGGEWGGKGKEEGRGGEGLGGGAVGRSAEGVKPAWPATSEDPNIEALKL